jgi:hypothetical protein
MFTEKFGNYVCEGDTITCEVDGFDVTARIYRDDNHDRPDERDDGFWPSRDPKAAGYVDPDKYETEMARARRVMEAWKNNEWWYCGVALEVRKNDVLLTHKFHHALWGVECNYPDSDNSYLSEVANELLSEAVKDARETIASLCES